MRTKIAIDDSLIAEAMRATGLRTPRQVVELGLQTLVRLDGQGDLRTLRENLAWDGDLEMMRRNRLDSTG